MALKAFSFVWKKIREFDFCTRHNPEVFSAAEHFLFFLSFHQQHKKNNSYPFPLFCYIYYRACVWTLIAIPPPSFVTHTYYRDCIWKLIAIPSLFCYIYDILQRLYLKINSYSFPLFCYIYYRDCNWKLIAIPSPSFVTYTTEIVFEN